MNSGIIRKIVIITSTIILIINFSTLAQQTIYVDDDGPADFNNIQAAIDDANDGDTVIVMPGTYTGDGNRDIDFLGKAITLKSQNGPESCIINCQGSEEDLHRGFNFQSGENLLSVLDGFTITNGCEYNGGAIWCGDYSSPTIKNCILRNNYAAIAPGFPGDWGTGGGGICCSQSNAKIINCSFSPNLVMTDRLNYEIKVSDEGDIKSAKKV